MEIDVAGWLNLLIRWAHIVVGIGWIGASFYFVALDFSLRKRPDMDNRLMGEAWQVHGGGFYHVKKYMIAPDNLPEKLIWYKWDAYLTWITGFALLVVQYYLNVDVYLITPQNNAEITPGIAIGISLISLFLGWMAYDLICRAMAGKSALITAVLVFLLIIFTAKIFSTVFSGRGALIHVGAFAGTIMAVNVFGVIIPNQRQIVDSLIAGEKPDPKLGVIGKQRSLHNNYLTLPVLLMMISNHYPILSSHEKTWLVVALVIVIGAAIRHLINRHEAGDELKAFGWALPIAGAALLAVVILTAPRTPASASAGNTGSAIAAIPDHTAFEIARTHCSACHAPVAGAEEYFIAPKDIKLETISDLRRYRSQVKAQTVTTMAMPMGNATKMTPEERRVLGEWIDQQKE